MFSIGSHRFKNRIVLAPMAGITDKPFRQVCVHYGAGLTFSEMMSANPRVWKTDKSKLRFSHNKEMGVNAVQLVGNDPKEIAYAAYINECAGAELIDINMGCPAKKVNRKMAGSALLQDPALVKQIIKSVVAAVDVPVSLKIRTGWDKKHKNCLEIAQIAQDAGIKALTIHGRTRACKFEGEAEYESIRQVKQVLDIPVIANGDITSKEKAREVLEYTGADAIMLGRGTLGRPWLFSEIERGLGQNSVVLPNFRHKCKSILTHINALHDFYGEQKGFRIARKHVGWYLQDLGFEPSFKRTFNAITNTKEQIIVLSDFLNSIQ